MISRKGTRLIRKLTLAGFSIEVRSNGEEIVLIKYGDVVLVEMTTSEFNRLATKIAVEILLNVLRHIQR